jgi:hypothetical protein
VAPAARTIEVLVLRSQRYTREALIDRDGTLQSALLPGFALPLTEMFQAR